MRERKAEQGLTSKIAVNAIGSILNLNIGRIGKAQFGNHRGGITKLLLTDVELHDQQANLFLKAAGAQAIKGCGHVREGQGGVAEAIFAESV